MLFPAHWCTYWQLTLDSFDPEGNLKTWRFSGRFWSVNMFSMFGFVRASYGKVNVPSLTLIRSNWGFIISPMSWYRPVSKLKKVLRSHSRKRIRVLRVYYMIDRDRTTSKETKCSGGGVQCGDEDGNCPPQFCSSNSALICEGGTRRRTFSWIILLQRIC